MGYYIECLNQQHKAQQLRETFPDAKFIGTIPPPFDITGKTVNVCVIQNGSFDAAGIAFSSKEQEVFAESDGRIKHWLTLTRELAIQLCPHVERYLVKLS